MQGLAYVGKIVSLQDIPNADFISSAEVVCGQGGKWRGVVKKGEFSTKEENRVIVYLPDAILPEKKEYQFLEKHGWRIRMMRFKGVPSEALILPWEEGYSIGADMTETLGVTRYTKPIPSNLQGKILREFPSFIPKTDEPNYQRSPELIDALRGKKYYIAEKADGSSTTAYKHKGHFGVCSRNYELVRDEENTYWKVALMHRLEQNLPDEVALQWETCGPKIQGNKMKLIGHEGFAFSAYDISKGCYFTFEELSNLCYNIKFPMVRVTSTGHYFEPPEFNEMHKMASGNYKFAGPREGIVVRSQYNMLHTVTLNVSGMKYDLSRAPISFKIINLDYEND